MLKTLVDHYAAEQNWAPEKTQEVMDKLLKAKLTQDEKIAEKVLATQELASALDQLGELDFHSSQAFPELTKVAKAAQKTKQHLDKQKEKRSRDRRLKPNRKKKARAKVLRLPIKVQSKAKQKVILHVCYESDLNCFQNW